jgi:hypothetical protein
VAKFHSWQEKRVTTVHGVVKVKRAYYYCQRCHVSYCPFDEVMELSDGISPGVRPLVCLAGTLVPFEDAAQDVLQRFASVRLSTSTVLRCTEAAGADLRGQQQSGRMVRSSTPEPGWSQPGAGETPAAYVGMDAFSVPMQGPGGAQADHRMMYLGTLYTPDHRHKRYLVDFDLDGLAEQLRRQAGACGLKEVKQLIAVTDGGNGLEESLCRWFADDLVTILDWYHAAEHVHAFAACWHGEDEMAAGAWSGQAKTILYEQGGQAFVEFLERIELPPRTRSGVREELRKLIGYFRNNVHRTDYPRYREKGWDIGSGPTEAGCKVVGERLKGSGMRWAESGAVQVATLRALYVSGPKLWDDFWSQSHRRAA